VLAVQHRLPAIYPYRFFVSSGGLASYGTIVFSWPWREKAVNKASCPAHGTTAALLIDNARGYDDLTEVGRSVGTIDDRVHKCLYADPSDEPAISRTAASRAWYSPRHDSDRLPSEIGRSGYGAAKVLADRYTRSWRGDLPLYLDGTIASIEAILSGGRPDWKREEVLQVLKEYKVVSDDSRALIAPSRGVVSSAASPRPHVPILSGERPV
jgi:hypothetical protein